MTTCFNHHFDYARTDYDTRCAYEWGNRVVMDIGLKLKCLDCGEYKRCADDARLTISDRGSFVTEGSTAIRLYCKIECDEYALILPR